MLVSCLFPTKANLRFVFLQQAVPEKDTGLILTRIGEKEAAIQSPIPEENALSIVLLASMDYLRVNSLKPEMTHDSASQCRRDMQR